MTLAKAKAKTNETFTVQASLTIVTYDHKNMFLVQATGSQNSYFYLDFVHFLTPALISHLFLLKAIIFLHMCLLYVVV
jgi:hypothetical protein